MYVCVYIYIYIYIYQTCQRPIRRHRAQTQGASSSQRAWWGQDEPRLWASRLPLRMSESCDPFRAAAGVPWWLYSSGDRFEGARPGGPETCGRCFRECWLCPSGGAPHGTAQHGAPPTVWMSEDRLGAPRRGTLRPLRRSDSYCAKRAHFTRRAPGTIFNPVALDCPGGRSHRVPKPCGQGCLRCCSVVLSRGPRDLYIHIYIYIYIYTYTYMYAYVLVKCKCNHKCVYTCKHTYNNSIS